MLRKGKGDTLEGSQWPVEGLALDCPLACFVDAGLGCAEAQQAERRPAEVEVLHGTREAPARLPHDVVLRHEDVVEGQLAPAQREAPHARRVRAGDALGVERDGPGTPLTQAPGRRPTPPTPPWPG